MRLGQCKQKCPRAIWAQSLRQFDLSSLGQIALGTVLPLAWLPDPISLGKFGCTGLVWFTSLNFSKDIRFPVLVIYAVDFFLHRLSPVNFEKNVPKKTTYKNTPKGCHLIPILTILSEPTSLLVGSSITIFLRCVFQIWTSDSYAYF